MNQYINHGTKNLLWAVEGIPNGFWDSSKANWVDCKTSLSKCTQDNNKNNLSLY